MSSPRKINLLVVPDLFPGYDGDVQGIFVRDYLTAVEPFCKVSVLFIRLTGAKKGLTVTQEGGATVYRYCFSTTKIPFYLKPFYYWAWFRKGYALRRQIEKPDLVHAHGTILSGTLACRLGKAWQVPAIITEHQGPFTMISDSFWKLAWARRTMQRADAVLTVSDHLRKEILASRIHPKTIHVTHNPVDTALFVQKPDRTYRNILFASRLDVFKGGLRTLKAFHHMAEANPDWKLTMVGDGEEYGAIEAYMRQHPELQSRVYLKGKMTKAEIAREMAEADFFVFPSLHESFGLVVAEAMSCGLPVIATNKTAPKEYISADSGILVPPEDVDAIAGAMQKMIQTHASYSASAIRGAVIERFGFENFGKKLNAIYQSLL